MVNDIYNASWEHGKKKTLGFYKKKLPWKEKTLNRRSNLPDLFAPMIGSKKKVRIAELGSGMFCTIGTNWPSAEVEIYPSDILANEFNQILKEAGVVPLIPVKYEDMENLSYRDNYFDIVYCVNALDHTINPIQAIKEMYRVTKPGGWIYLKCFIDVGEKEKYAGMHKWNINMDKNNNLIAWKQGKIYQVENYVTGFKSTKTVEPGHEDDEMIVSILQK